MPSKEEFMQWKAARFGTEFDIWHDGFDTSRVQSLTGDSRTSTISMLRTGVELGDAHAATALAAMSEGSSVPELRSQLAQSRGGDKVRVALAIHALSPDQSLAKELVEVLEDASLHWSEQSQAAIGLSEFRETASEQALLRAVEQNGAYLVRYHASNSLLSRWQVIPSNISKHPEIFSLIKGPGLDTTAEDQQARMREAVIRFEQLRKRDE